MPAKPLSEEQIQDAHRLRKEYERVRDERGGLTQEQLAFMCGWKTQGAVFQYISGKIPLNPKALIKFSKALEVDPKSISPNLSKYIVDLEKEITLERTPKVQALDQISIDIVTPELEEILSTARTLGDFFNDNFKKNHALKIPRLKALNSMGNGSFFNYEGQMIIEELMINKSWIQQNVKADPEKLQIISGYGDSMHPTFNDGDLLLVDVSKKDLDSEGVYVFCTSVGLFIKRFRKRLDGTFEISSDNPTVKAVDVIRGEKEITLEGRVVWAWNGRSL